MNERVKKLFSTEKYYMAFVEFLLLQKRMIVNTGLSYGLTPMQTIALLAIDEPRPMYYITALLNCDASNVTGIIDGLQKKDLALRYEDKQDRRIRMVRLKAKGLNLRLKLIDELLDNNNPIFSKLTESELDTLFEIIEKITQPPDDKTL